MKTPTTLTDSGCDRATAYHMSNKIVRTKQGVFVTWIDSEFRNVLAELDDSGNVVQQYAWHQGYDNHCGAALTITPDGTLHMIGGSHGQGFHYITSMTPWDSKSWSLPQCVGITATYPSLVYGPDGTLHLAHRRAAGVGDEHFGLAWHLMSPGSKWGLHRMLGWRMPAPLYSFPTNALAVAPDGKLHIVMEWYKTWPNDIVEPQSLGVSHFVLDADPVTKAPAKPYVWRHTDGREVKGVPIKYEETYPMLIGPGKNPRPGNIAILPDGRPVTGVLTHNDKECVVLIQQADLTWKYVSLGQWAKANNLAELFGSQPQIAVNAKGEIVVAVVMNTQGEWGGDGAQIHVFIVDASQAKVIRHEAVPKVEPNEPDWLASIEKPGPGIYPEKLHLIYQTGKRGVGCVNAATTRVRHVMIG